MSDLSSSASSAGMSERAPALDSARSLPSGPSSPLPEIPEDTQATAEQEASWMPAPEVLEAWDARLRDLWSPSLSAALTVASELFAPATPDPDSPGRVESHVSAEFWRLLTSRQKRVPATPLARYQCVVATVWRLLRTMRQSPSAPFVEEHLAVALRPVRLLRAGMLTPEVCAALYDFHRGLWAPYLTKPQLWILRTALAETLAGLPLETMQPFWDGLESRDAMMSHAMTLGLALLREAHAVPHLLRGLEQTHTHAARAAIVECLEEVGDPHALGALARLRRETAGSDWTLSRQIARTIRVIEQQNPGAHVRTLLRASDTPPDYDLLLLRPAEALPDKNAPSDRNSLLRPKEKG